MKTLIAGTLVLVTLALSGSALAETSEEAVTILESAERGDAEALDRLRQVEDVDGVPVDIEGLQRATEADPSLAAELIRSGFITDPGPEVEELVATVLAQDRFARSSTSATSWASAILRPACAPIHPRLTERPVMTPVPARRPMPVWPEAVSDWIR